MAIRVDAWIMNNEPPKRCRKGDEAIGKPLQTMETMVIYWKHMGHMVIYGRYPLVICYIANWKIIINGGFIGKIICKWAIFQFAMLIYQMVTITVFQV